MNVLAAPPLAAIAAPTRLRTAWEHVYRNDREDGDVAPSIARFAEAADTRIAELSGALAAGEYRPQPLTAVRIPKPDGGHRELRIPTAADRVVERAVATSLAPVLDPHFSPSSFGYRSGLGVSNAVERVVDHRESGFGYGVRTDVSDCFPTVDRARVLRMAEAVIGPGTLMDLVALLVDRYVRGMRRVLARRGLAQGGALAPLLANLYLTDFDQQLFRRGVTHVRYADDMVLLAKSADSANQSFEIAERALARGGQRMGSKKTEVVSFGEGFAFLGEEFTARYPPMQAHPRRDEPAQRTVYVGYQGAGVRASKGRLLVERNDASLLSVPQSHVGRVVLSGSVGLSAGARSWAMYNGIDVVLLSRRGSYMGSVTAYRPNEAQLRRDQYRHTGTDEWSVALAKRIVFGKTSNQRTLLLRYGSGEAAESVAPGVDEIERYRASLRDAETLDEVRGIEGISARRYWEAMIALIPDAVGFRGRVRQPPGDVANAALGYGYSILLGECISALLAVGLDPAAGCLHSDHQRRPSLALDLMEEFRPVVIDSVVVAKTRRHQLTSEHGRTDDARDGGVLLTAAGRKALVKSVEDRLLTLFKHIPSGHRVTYRRAIQLQAAQIASAVRSGEVDYQPSLWR